MLFKNMIKLEKVIINSKEDDSEILELEYANEKIFMEDFKDIFYKKFLKKKIK